MTKKDLIELVARKAHLTKKASTEAIETFLNEVQRALVKGDKVILSGFGVFEITQRSKKEMFLRHKKEEIPAHRALRFKIGKTLRRAIKK